MSNIKPLGQRVLVEKSAPREQSEGGIILPQSSQENVQEAVVLAIGTGSKDKNGNDVPFNVKEGDKVIVAKYVGTEIEDSGKKLVIVHQDDLLAVIEG